jgi:hypothetical protein
VEADILPVKLKTLKLHLVGVETCPNTPRQHYQGSPVSWPKQGMVSTAARNDTGRANKVDGQLQSIRRSHNFEHRVGSSSISLSLDLLDGILIQVDGNGSVGLGLL